MTRRVTQQEGAQVTYTNRKGVTYYLCQGYTVSGKTRYYFARTPRDEAVTAIPAGHSIVESVNGIVSLTKERPSPLRADEVATVEAEVQRHPRGRRYRVSTKGAQIIVHEPYGPDADELVALLSEHLLVPSSTASERMRDFEERHAQYTPVVRFSLEDAGDRTFTVERMCYRSSIDGWLAVGWGPIDQLARTVIPTLGSDAFFELMP